MIRMVGGGKRVLDIGCWNGDLGAHLRSRNTEVVGLEQDAEAAATAAARLDSVITGDVETLDLLDTFGPARFDVIVLGDVLEHLVEPDRTLRRVRPLLSTSGYVVASIPNVAHGSVRLNLLQGDFRYTDVGLLDRTHLRFFTRRSLEELFENAGFVVVETRTTTVDPLSAPEGPIVPAPGDGPVIERVQGDPDAHVYQFVVRAVPDDADHAILELRRRERELEREVAELRRTPAARRRGRQRAAVQVALAGNECDLPARWCAELLEGELARRWPEVSLALLDAEDASLSQLRWSDALISLSEHGAPGPGARGSELGLDLSSATLASVAGVGPSLVGVALLATRARKSGAGLGRAPLLRLLGLLPSDHTYVVVALDSTAVPDETGLAVVLHRLQSGAGQIVLLPLEGDQPVPLFDALPATTLPDWLVVEDVVAVLDGAAAVVTTHPTVALLAYALRRPHALVGGDRASSTLLATLGGGVAEGVTDIESAVFRTEALPSDAPRIAEVQALVDDTLDALVEHLRLHQVDPHPAPDAEYVRSLEDSITALQIRIVQERERMAAAFDAIEADRLLDASGAETRAILEHEAELLREAADTYRVAIADLQEQLHRVVNEPVAVPVPIRPRWRRTVGAAARRAGLRRR